MRNRESEIRKGKQGEGINDLVEMLIPQICQSFPYFGTRQFFAFQNLIPAWIIRKPVDKASSVYKI